MNSDDVLEGSFNGKPHGELLDGELFYTLHEAKVLIERRCVHYNTIRPHSALGYRPPAPEAIAPPADSVPHATHVPIRPPAGNPSVRDVR